MLADLRWSRLPPDTSHAGVQPNASAAAGRVRRLASELARWRARRPWPEDESVPIVSLQQRQEELEKQEKELLGTVRGFLDAVISLSCGPAAAAASKMADSEATLADVSAGLADVRQLLHLATVANALREFIGGLLYLVLTTEPLEQDLHTWLARSQYLGLLRRLCDDTPGGMGVVEERCAAAVARGCCLRPCPECSVRHMAVQEAFSLVRYFRGHCEKAAGGDVAVHLQDGLLMILEAIYVAMSSLHSCCAATTQSRGAREAGLCWRAIHGDLQRSSRAAQSPWGCLMVAPMVMQQLDAIVDVVEALDRRPPPPPPFSSRACGTAPFRRREGLLRDFPPELKAQEL
eukprot:TRINITY_DN4708_c1_g1_i1.p1 TRINITY_DN4708_c1_g1~~TRINITY_DN4708_c1_g1_i1.p1  ORF type:complete len:347 (-),score=63.78 TRINITY_DN4708_c1_g1_i1:178-1218(-)